MILLFSILDSTFLSRILFICSFRESILIICPFFMLDSNYLPLLVLGLDYNNEAGF